MIFEFNQNGTVSFDYKYIVPEGVAYPGLRHQRTRLIKLFKSAMKINVSVIIERGSSDGEKHLLFMANFKGSPNVQKNLEKYDDEYIKENIIPCIEFFEGEAFNYLKKEKEKAQLEYFSNSYWLNEYQSDTIYSLKKEEQEISNQLKEVRHQIRIEQAKEAINHIENNLDDGEHKNKVLNILNSKLESLKR